MYFNSNYMCQEKKEEEEEKEEDSPSLKIAWMQ